jgi:hypothetical protein
MGYQFPYPMGGQYTIEIHAAYNNYSNNYAGKIFTSKPFIINTNFCIPTTSPFSIEPVTPPTNQSLA